MIRSKYVDPDFRPRPKTERYCFICSRDLKAGQPHRIIHVDFETMEAVHPDDLNNAATKLEALPIGMDCARNLGLEWSTEGIRP